MPSRPLPATAGVPGATRVRGRRSDTPLSAHDRPDETRRVRPLAMQDCVGDIDPGSAIIGAMTDRRRLFQAFVTCSLACGLPLLVGCGGGSGGRPGGGGSGNFRATIDGQTWVADANTTQVTANAATPGFLTMSGTRVASASNYLSLTLSLGYIDGAKTYPLGVNQGSNAGGSGQIIDQAGATLGIWVTDFSGARGTLTVTSMSAARFAGTFAFTAPPQIGSTVTNTRVVTDGSFDLPLPAAFQPPAADDYGSAIAATLNGEPWNGATVVGLGDTAAGALSFGAMTTGVSLSFVTSVPVQAGQSYDQSGVRLTALNGAASWGTTGGTSTVTVTALSAKRVAGTFSAMLSPAGTATAALAITGGTFDVKILPVE
jgi:hypothetical protein